MNNDEVAVPTNVSSGESVMPGSADSLPMTSDSELSQLFAEATPRSAPAAPPSAPPSTEQRTKPSTEQPTEQPEDPVAAAITGAVKRGRPALQRDYAGMDDDEKEIFSNMSNSAYTKLRPIYDSYKKSGGDFTKLTGRLTELETKLSEAEKSRWRDHPEAYKLTPEYQTATETVGQAQAVLNHWQEQLAAIDNGSKEIAMLRLNPESGKITSYKVPVSTATRSDLIRRMTQAHADLTEVNKELDGIKQQHAHWYGEHDKAITGLYEKYFKPHENDLKPHLDKLMSAFPARVAQSPEGRLMLNALAANMAMLAGNAANTAQNQISATRQRTAKAAGPTSADIQQTSAVKTGNAFSKAPTEEEFKAFAKTFL